MSNQFIPISIFTPCYPPAKGGVETLAYHLKQLLDTRYKTHIFTGPGMTLDSYQTLSHFTYQKLPQVHRLPLLHTRQWLANQLFGRFIHRYSLPAPYYFGPHLRYHPQHLQLIAASDMIFGLGMPTKSFLDAYTLAKRFHKPLILHPSFHDTHHYRHSRFFQSAFNYATVIIYQTPPEKTALQHHYHLPEDKLVQLTLAPYRNKSIDTKQYTTVPLPERSTVRLGFIGQITLRKNLRYFKSFLDRQLPKFRQQHLSLTLHLAGAQTNASPQIEAILEPYLDRQIVTINYDFTDLSSEFDQFDYFINPSYEESLGYTNFEAIYYQKPVILHRNHPFTKLRDASFLPTFTSTQKLAAIIQKFHHQPHTLNLLIKQQLKLLQQYSIDRYSRSLTRLLSKVISQSTSPSPAKN